MEESRCRVCRSFLDPEDLFCSNCGTENLQGVDTAGVGVDETSALQTIASIHSFQCEQCGASMSYDASAQQLRCPFCGSEKLTSRPTARTIRPKSVIPFRVPHRDVEGLIRKWLSQGFWRPGDASKDSVISKVTAVFVPFWVFYAQADVSWTADTSAVPAGARANWYPISGTTEERFDNVLVGASGTLTPVEVRDLCPFDLSKSVAPEELDLHNIVVEEFRTTRRDARNMAQAILEQQASRTVQSTIRGNVRNLRVNLFLRNMKSTPLLLPVWIMVYHYKQKPYRVLINGQTGEVTGAAPFSGTKLAVVIAAVLAITILIGFLIVLASAVR
jgi:RNA polymerase subunit RPABC4/transcription elongation factor Spt4